MENHRIKIRAFGMLAEKIGSEELVWNHFHSLEEFKNSLLKSYPQLNQMKFSIAINKKLVTGNAEIPESAEIALLPPFSGG